MQAIMEPIFEIPYLVGVVTLGILILRQAQGDRQFVLFGALTVLLGCGDAFHLIPRMWYLFTTGVTTLPEQAAALGVGKLVTSITMTVFYVMLYHVWQLRYKPPARTGLTVSIYLCAAARIFLCLLPQNQWLSADTPLEWGIYRNIPFVVMGIILIVLFFIEAHKKSDKAFRFMWLAITLSFLFYIPVVLFANIHPMIGMLMIPKTCAYVWIVWMGFRAVKNKPLA